jgi:hypothetical protein
MNVPDLYRETPAADVLAVGEREAARMLSVSTRHLFTLRKRGDGPRHKRAGNRVIYAVTELRRWAGEHDPAADPDKPNAAGAERGGE